MAGKQPCIHGRVLYNSMKDVSWEKWVNFSSFLPPPHFLSRFGRASVP